MNTGLLEYVRKNLKVVDGEWVPNAFSSFWFYSSIIPFYTVVVAIRLNERRKSIEIYKKIKKQ